MPDFALIGPSTDASKFYVLARPPGHDRIGIYLYDLQKEDFGSPLVENPNYDIAEADVSDDGSRVRYHCYDVNVRVCEFADTTQEAYMRGVRKFFDEQANVYITGASNDGKVILLHVDSPSDAPSRGACSSGVNPSPSETMFSSCSTGSTSR